MAKKQIYTIENSWIDWTQFILIALLAPFFLFPSMKYAWILFIVPLIWIWRCIITKKFFERSVLDWAIFILAVQVFTTCLIVPDLAFSLPKITGVLFGIVFFYSIIALLKTERLIKAGIVLFLGGGLVLSVIGILGMIRFNVKYLDELAKISTIIPKINFNLPGAEKGFHPNAVGGTLILIIPLFFILFFSYLRWKNKYDFTVKNKLFSIALFIGLLFTSGVLLLTQSRGSWLALILSSCILLFPIFEKKKKYILSLFLLFPIGLFLFISVYFMVVGNEKIPFSKIELMQKAGGRSQAWTVGIESIKHHPFTGIGMNRIRLNPKIGYEMAHIHNHFIHTAAELGIPGLAAYLVILIGTGIMCVQVWKRSTIGWMRMVVLGLGWGQFAQVIFGIADSIPLGAKVGVFFWMSIALIAVIHNFVMSEQFKNLQQTAHSL